MEDYVTGTGQHIGVHNRSDCRGEHCVIHNPSMHIMSAWPTHWRQDRYLMERICQHGIGHPDPDHINFLPKAQRAIESMHGCDGCCHD